MTDHDNNGGGASEGLRHAASTLVCSEQPERQTAGCRELLDGEYRRLVTVVDDCDPAQRVEFIESTLGGLPDSLVLLELDAQPSMAVADLPPPVSHERVDPADLVTLGTTLVEEADQYPDGTLAVCLGPLESLLAVHDESAVFKFLHVVGSRLEAADARFHAHLQEASGRTCSTLGTPFEAVAEDTGTGWQVRGD